MGEELRYRIRFTKGSLSGQLFPLGAESVIIGRSHTCGIRVMEPDVSGRHIMLAVGAKGVELEVISSRRTQLDGKALKTGDAVPVTAGQEIAMGGSVQFVVECYRSEGDETEAPVDLTGGMTRFGTAMPDMDATAKEGRGIAPGGRAMDATSLTAPAVAGPGDDDDTGTHVPPGGGGRTAARPPMPSRSGRGEATGGPPTSFTRTVGTQAFPTPGATLATEALRPSADATQIIQTRAATPQEMAYMRELHNKKRRRRLGARLGLGGALTLVAGGLCFWMAFHAPEQFLTDPPERADWMLLDGALKPVPEELVDSVEDYLFMSYPASGGWGTRKTGTQANAALGVTETVFEVKTRVGRDLDVPLQLRLAVYPQAASLDQSQEDSFADWDRTNGLGIEKQSILPTDFLGADPGLPCLRYTYTRKATPEEEAQGVLDWGGVLSFFRLRDTCFVYFREVPSVDELRAENLLSRTSVYLGITTSLIEERWAGMRTEQQYSAPLPILRNSAKELMDKKMDNEWGETEDKLGTILIRTYPRRMQDPEAGRLYAEALGWMRELRARQAETWKRRCVTRYCVPASGQEAEGKRQDEAIRALFNSPDDRRHYIAQKEDWWMQ